MKLSIISQGVIWKYSTVAPQAFLALSFSCLSHIKTDEQENAAAFGKEKMIGVL